MSAILTFDWETFSILLSILGHFSNRGSQVSCEYPQLHFSVNLEYWP
jgi:hypothetical protein